MSFRHVNLAQRRKGAKIGMEFGIRLSGFRNPKSAIHIVKSPVLFPSRLSALARVIVVACVLFCVSVHAADGPQQLPLTGNAKIDLCGLRALTGTPEVLQEEAPLALPSHRSPWLAAGMSALVPGSGQIYTGSYWEAALFVAADVAAWLIAYKYDKDGDKKTEEFEAFANLNWSVVKYAEYTEKNLVPTGKVYTWRKAGTESMDPFDHPWTQVNWDVINQMERDIAGYYSHTLPAYGEQQYFELIGKYPQFGQGWRDADPTIGSDYETIKAHLSPMFRSYSVERGKANDFYDSASSWVTVAIVNHLLSAADAAWSAVRYNKAQASASLRLLPAGDHYAWMAMGTIKLEF